MSSVILAPPLRVLASVKGARVNPDRWLEDRGWIKTARGWRRPGRPEVICSRREAVGLQLVAENEAIVEAMGLR
jgi:hypothetical protein